MSGIGQNSMGLSSPYPALPPPRRVSMVVTPLHACAYLPDRQAQLRAFYATQVSGEVYHDFMDAGFRRAGRIIYQPVCQGCRACMPIRVPVAEFAANKSLRRCRRHNQDLTVHIDPPTLTDEKLDLYRRYMAQRHHSPADEDRTKLEEFLYQSPVQTLEFTYRDRDGRLLAVGICDVCSRSLSSVYFFYDPDHSRRSLGNFGALIEIEYARQLNIPHWYIGYWVKGCGAMEYKANFHPYELLCSDGVWRREDEIMNYEL
jgi:arginine-tRNA-protein transferase